MTECLAQGKELVLLIRRILLMDAVASVIQAIMVTIVKQVNQSYCLKKDSKYWLGIIIIVIIEIMVGYCFYIFLLQIMHIRAL